MAVVEISGLLRPVDCGIHLAAAIDVFYDHPDQWALLGERPELAPRAEEEAMRYRPIGF